MPPPAAGSTTCMTASLSRAYINARERGGGAHADGHELVRTTADPEWRAGPAAGEPDLAGWDSHSEHGVHRRPAGHHAGGGAAGRAPGRDGGLLRPERVRTVGG